MDKAQLTLVISFDAGTNTAEETLFELTGQVQQQLRKAGVNLVNRPSYSELFTGMKGSAIEVSTLIAILTSTQAVITTILLLRDWVWRRENRTVKIKAEVSGRCIEVEYSSQTTSSEELIAFAEKLIRFTQDPSSSPPSMPQLYRRQNIRMLLTEGFSLNELRRLCYDGPEFKPVYEQLAPETGKDKMIDLLIEHADRKLLTGDLLEWAKMQNPAQYEACQPYV